MDKSTACTKKANPTLRSTLSEILGIEVESERSRVSDAAAACTRFILQFATGLVIAFSSAHAQSALPPLRPLFVADATLRPKLTFVYSSSAPNQQFDAQFVSQSVPTPMFAGLTYTASITLKNTGNTTWTNTTGPGTPNAYSLGSQNPRDNSQWGIAPYPSRVPVSGSVTSGATAAFTFNVVAPPTPGTYDFQWQMVDDFVTWFGSLTPNVKVVVIPPGFAPNAQFVSQSVPSPMVAGQTYTASITLKNTGNTTWTNTTGPGTPNAYSLGSQNPQDNSQWGIAPYPGRVPVSGSVTPSATATFTFNVVAPTTPGTYDFQWQMVDDFVTWFGSLTPNVKVVVIPPGFAPNAQFLSQSVPSSMVAGQTYTTSITLKNTGNTTWINTTGPGTPNAYSLGSQNPQDNRRWGFAPYPNRVPVSGSVTSGASATFMFNVVAPTTAGAYDFQWQMVDDFVTWFGSLTPNIRVVVTSPATKTDLASDTNPADYGATVKLTATVHGATPTGTVSFADNGSPLCTNVALSGGGNNPTAACAPSTLSLGTHSIVARYSGDGGNATSSSAPLLQIITDGFYTGLTDNTWTRIAAADASAPPWGIAAYSGMAVDDSRGQLLLFGGGHHNYWGNEVWALPLDSRTWVQQYEPDPFPTMSDADIAAGVDNANQPGVWLPSARPYTRETYSSVVFISHLGVLMSGGSSTYDGPDGTWWNIWLNDPRDTWFYNPTLKAWTYKGSALTDPARSYTGCAAYNPADRKVYSMVLDRFYQVTTWRFDPDLNVWTNLNPSSAPPTANDPPCTFDTKRGRLLMFSGNGPTDLLWSYDVATNDWTNMTPRIGSVPAAPDSGAGGMAYDSVSDVIASYNDAGFWIYDYATGAFTKPSASGPSITAFGLHGMMKYDPARNVTWISFPVGLRLETWAYRYKHL